MFILKRGKRQTKRRKTVHCRRAKDIICIKLLNECDLYRVKDRQANMECV